jgi:hypothetical protein
MFSEDLHIPLIRTVDKLVHVRRSLLPRDSVIIQINDVNNK